MYIEFGNGVLHTHHFMQLYWDTQSLNKCTVTNSVFMNILLVSVLKHNLQEYYIRKSQDKFVTYKCQYHNQIWWKGCCILIGPNHNYLADHLIIWTS